MRSVSPSNPLFQPGDLDAGDMQSALWYRAREWLGGGRFWSAVLVFLLSLAVSKSTGPSYPNCFCNAAFAVLSALLSPVARAFPRSSATCK